MKVSIDVTDYQFLLKNKFTIELDKDSLFKEIKDIYFDYIKNNNILNSNNKYIKYLVTENIIADEQYFQDKFKIIHYGKLIDLNEKISYCASNTNYIAIIINFN